MAVYFLDSSALVKRYISEIGSVWVLGLFDPISELSRDEEPSLEEGATYPIWSPLNSHAAAHQLAQLLKLDG
ncbi:MAG: hypothetical protein V7L14_29155 [Nostoc sp.]|uniref:hypothetical protein n=1 Tax=Nostoc sp. TaxID=1180 RepID=UPI002FF88FEC